MSSFTRPTDDEGVLEMAQQVLEKYETHKPLLDAKVRIDYLLAWPDEDEKGDPTGPALMHHGFQVLGVVRKLPIKDRVKGLGDAEVVLDGEWWADEARTDAEKIGLLDHELHHLEVVKDDEDKVQKDSANRPKLRLRKHDVEFAGFKIVAVRNGEASWERIEAKKLLEDYGPVFLAFDHPAAGSEEESRLTQ